MPDYVPIQDLTIVGSIGNNDLFPMSDGSGAYAVKGSTIKSYAASDAAAAAADAAASAADAALSKTAAQNAATSAGNAQTAAENVGTTTAAAIAQFDDKLSKDADDMSATPLTFVDGYWIETETSTIGSPIATITTFAYAKVACQEGDRFTVTGTGASRARLFAFADSNGNVIDRSPPDITVVDFVLTAPTGSAWLIINDNSGSTSFSGVSDRARSKVCWDATAKTGLYVSNENSEFPKVPVLREATTLNLSYLIDIEPGESYRITKSSESARLILGAVNNLITDTSNRPIGKIFYRNPTKTVAEFNNTDYKYLLVQVCTSSYPTMPDITVEKIKAGSVLASIPSFAIPSTVADYHQLWTDHIVTNGGKFGENSVCYRELLTSVHDLPIYAYFISFDTLRVHTTSSYVYSIDDTVDGEIPYGDFANGLTKKKVVLISGVHGDEKGGPIGLFQWIYNLCYNPKFEQYRCYDYYIVPIVNPTGYNANTRNNADGVNINRDATTQSTLEAQAVSGFIAEQDADMFVDFHQAALPWEATNIPYYGFVSSSPLMDATILKSVNQAVFRTVAKSDKAVNQYMLDSTKPQGAFLWGVSGANVETFKDFASQYCAISFTLETSQKCPYYTGTTDNYEFTALVCNQTFIDSFMEEMMAFLHE